MVCKTHHRGSDAARIEQRRRCGELRAGIVSGMADGWRVDERGIDIADVDVAVPGDFRAKGFGKATQAEFAGRIRRRIGRSRKSTDGYHVDEGASLLP